MKKISSMIYCLTGSLILMSLFNFCAISTKTVEETAPVEAEFKNDDMVRVKASYITGGIHYVLLENVNSPSSAVHELDGNIKVENGKVYRMRIETSSPKEDKVAKKVTLTPIDKGKI